MPSTSCSCANLALLLSLALSTQLVFCVRSPPDQCQGGLEWCEEQQECVRSWAEDCTLNWPKPDAEDKEDTEETSLSPSLSLSSAKLPEPRGDMDDTEDPGDTQDKEDTDDVEDGEDTDDEDLWDAEDAEGKEKLDDRIDELESDVVPPSGMRTPDAQSDDGNQVLANVQAAADKKAQKAAAAKAAEDQLAKNRVSKLKPVKKKVLEGPADEQVKERFPKLKHVEKEVLEGATDEQVQDRYPKLKPVKKQQVEETSQVDKELKNEECNLAAKKGRKCNSFIKKICPATCAAIASPK